jgi:hypothetical protein
MISRQLVSQSLHKTRTRCATDPSSKSTCQPNRMGLQARTH